MITTLDAGFVGDGVESTGFLLTGETVGEPDGDVDLDGDGKVDGRRCGRHGGWGAC